MFELREYSAFKHHLRDLLVQAKGFASQDNAELFAEEVLQQQVGGRCWGQWDGGSAPGAVGWGQWAGGSGLGVGLAWLGARLSSWAHGQGSVSSTPCHAGAAARPATPRPTRHAT
jgi:hypothetical protein